MRDKRRKFREEAEFALEMVQRREREMGEGEAFILDRTGESDG
jgi:hypothetical protein